MNMDKWSFMHKRSKYTLVRLCLAGRETSVYCVHVDQGMVYRTRELMSVQEDINFHSLEANLLYLIHWYAK